MEGGRLCGGVMYASVREGKTRVRNVRKRSKATVYVKYCGARFSFQMSTEFSSWNALAYPAPRSTTKRFRPSCPLPDFDSGSKWDRLHHYSPEDWAVDHLGSLCAC